jgi:predicted nucleic acid-binding protein
MVLVDSNIILDIMTEDKNWCDWAIRTLENQHEPLAINPIIYAEVSVKIESIETLDEAIQSFKRLPLPYEASFLAGKAFLNFLKNKGKRTNTLPYFFIGAHAAILKIPLITRDIRRYKLYFPSVKLIHP